MFKDDEDVRNTLKQIIQLKEFLDEHIKDKLDEPVPKEVVGQLEKLKVSIGFFREFIQTFLKSIGMSETEIAKNTRFHVKGRDPAAEKLIREADSIKCQLLLSQAQFIKHQYQDFLDSNRPFVETKKIKGLQEVQKKKVKKKFKTMNRRQKWNKM